MATIGDVLWQVLARRRTCSAAGAVSFVAILILSTFPAWATGPTLGEPPVAPSTLPLLQPLAPSSAAPQGGLTVDTQNRQAVIDFYNSHYLSTQGVAMEWTGDHATCTAGTTALAFREAMLQRINFFRAMAGVPADITLDETYNQKAQQAALLMSVNRGLEHKPPPDWQCYNAEASEGAGKSNLAGVHAVAAIDAYMADIGDGNAFVGHRRWLLHPLTQKMGTGDVPSVADYGPANALWVVDEQPRRQRPATREEFVAWPPPGFVPKDLVYARWSLAYPQAVFANATVTLTLGGQVAPVVVPAPKESPGDNTLVWEPDAALLATALLSTTGEITATVTISNVRVQGEVRSFAYTVILFNPADPAPTPAPATPVASTPTPVSPTPVPGTAVYLAVVRR